MEAVKCAHEPCTCNVKASEQYCSRVCKENASGAGGATGPQHGACHCGHTACEDR